MEHVETLPSHNGPTLLRIAFLDSWLQTAVDGSGTAVGIDGLEQTLRRHGHTVDRIAPPTHGLWRRLPITARRLCFNLLLPQRLRPSAYDLVVGFDWDGVWLRRGRTPFVCSIKGIIAEELQHERGRIRLLFSLLARLEGMNARRADRVLTTSRYCRDRIARHYRVPAANIAIVPEGIDVGEWRAALVAAPPRRDLRPTILCVARQYPRKHVADLIAAFALLCAHVPDARLRIVGDGPEHAALVALAQALGVAEQVVFLGGIPDPAVRHEYSHCDLFCLPSVQEGFGIVLLEAMVAGVPVVSTTAAAIPEVVQHGVTGILVPPSEPHSLAGALLLLLTDHERRARYSAAAHTAVMDYDWNRVTNRFLSAVHDLAAGGAAQH